MNKIFSLHAPSSEKVQRACTQVGMGPSLCNSQVCLECTSRSRSRTPPPLLPFWAWALLVTSTHCAPMCATCLCTRTTSNISTPVNVWLCPLCLLLDMVGVGHGNSFGCCHCCTEVQMHGALLGNSKSQPPARPSFFRRTSKIETSSRK